MSSDDNMVTSSPEKRFFATSGERLIQYYADLVDVVEEKLVPSSRHGLDQKRNLNASIQGNLLLLQEAQDVLDDEWENLLHVYELLKRSGKHELLIQFMDGVLLYAGSRGEWSTMEKWLAQGIQSAEAIGDSESTAVYQLELGWLTSERGDQEKALDYYHEALSYYKKESTFGEALTYLRLGWLSHHANDQEKAKEYFATSLDLYEKLNHPIGIANATLGLGSMYEENLEWEKAKHHTTKALNIYNHLGDPTGVAAAYNHFARQAMMQGDHTLARDYYLRDLDIIEKAGDKQGIAQSELGLARLEIVDKEYEAALEHLNSARFTFSELEDKDNLADAYSLTAQLYMEMEEFDKAIESFRSAIPLFENVGKTHMLADLYGQLGLAFSLKGEGEVSIKYFSIAHNYFKDLDDPAQVVETMINNVSKAFTSENEIKQKLDFYEILSKKLIDFGNSRELALIHVAIGDAFRKDTKLLNHALESYEKALTTFDLSNDSWRMADALDRCGEICKSTEKWDKAISYYSKSIPLFQENDDYARMGWVYDSLGTCYTKKEDWEKALDAHGHALAARMKTEDISGIGWSHLSLGMIHKTLERWTQAAVHYQEIVSLGLQGNDLKKTCWAFQHLGDIYFVQGNNDQALFHYQEALETWRLLPDQQGVLVTPFTDIGRTLERMGQIEEAVEAYTEASQASEMLGNHEKLGYRYLDLANAYRQLDKNEEALQKYRMAYELFIQAKYFEGLLLAANAQSLIYEARGDWNSVIYYDQGILSLAQHLLTEQELAELYSRLGYAHINLGDQDTAIEYYQRGFDLFVKIDDPIGMDHIARVLEVVDGNSK